MVLARLDGYMHAHNMQPFPRMLNTSKGGSVNKRNTMVHGSSKIPCAFYVLEYVSYFVFESLVEDEPALRCVGQSSRPFPLEPMRLFAGTKGFRRQRLRQVCATG